MPDADPRQDRHPDLRPAVTEIVPAAGRDAGAVLPLVAALEQYSKHPLALAVTRYARERHLPPPAVLEVSERPGEGLRGRVDGADVLVTGRQSAVAKAVAGQLPPVHPGLEALVFAMASSRRRFGSATNRGATAARSSSTWPRGTASSERSCSPATGSRK